MKIRPAEPSDAAQVRELVQGILGREFAQAQAAYPTDDLERLEKSYGGAADLFLVAEEDGRVVGTCGVKAEDQKTAILRRLFVSRPHRKQGLGLRLLNEALVFCKARGFRDVIIRTSSTMEQAIRLCCSLGFREEGRWEMGGATLVRFRLRLSS